MRAFFHYVLHRDRFWFAYCVAILDNTIAPEVVYLFIKNTAPGMDAVFLLKVFFQPVSNKGMQQVK